MSILSKMLRIAGRGDDGNAKAIATNDEGVLKTQLTGSNPVIQFDDEILEPGMSASYYFPSGDFKEFCLAFSTTSGRTTYNTMRISSSNGESISSGVRQFDYDLDQENEVYNGRISAGRGFFIKPFPVYGEYMRFAIGISSEDVETTIRNLVVRRSK